ncbi:GlsB/YeaQ/YmgE family stress response membrane protein [Actinocorallia longicatena]|uniref:Transglycosylase n=1 Tax=Actinocorallia longicatena TaxID=111803 RepID=A0ABP6Q8Z0_9ACTN
MTISGIISAIVFGAIIGALGRLVVPGRQSMPIWLTTVVGIIAAFAGTGLARMFDLKTSGFNFWEVLFQVAIAALAVFIVAALWPKSRDDY